MTVTLHPLRVLVLVAVVVVGCSDTATTPPPVTTPTVAATDAGRLALVMERSIVVQEADGSRHELVPPQGEAFPITPQWSPDGRVLAFALRTFNQGQAGADWGDDIYTVPAAGGTPQLVRRHGEPGEQVQGMAWTPDSRALVFGLLVNQFKRPEVAAHSALLVRREIESGDERTLREGAMWPSLSRDGTRMAYLVADDAFGYPALVVADADASDEQELFKGNMFPGLIFPTLSPDGSTVVFSAVERFDVRAPRSRGALAMVARWFMPGRAEAHGLPMDIWSADTATGESALLADLKEDEPCTAWSVDGRMLVVLATGGLYEMAADGTDIRRLGRGAFGGQVSVH